VNQIQDAVDSFSVNYLLSSFTHEATRVNISREIQNTVGDNPHIDILPVSKEMDDTLSAKEFHPFNFPVVLGDYH
jgi:hypothetical protein